MIVPFYCIIYWVTPKYLAFDVSDKFTLCMKYLLAIDFLFLIFLVAGTSVD